MAHPLLEKITSAYPRLSRRQKRIAHYFLNHYKDAVFLTAAHIAKEVGVSPSTVVRFAGIMGFQGFPEFQNALRDVVRKDRSTVSRLIAAADLHSDDQTLLGEVFQSDIDNLTGTQRELDLQALVRAANTILSASHIHIVGLRSAHSLAVFLHFALSLTLGRAQLIVPGIGDIPEQLCELKKRDVLFAISFERYTRQTFEVLDFAARKGLVTIALTDKSTSPLALKADIVLLARTALSSFVESYVAPLSVLNALVTLIASKNRERTLSLLSQYEKVWEETRLYL